MSSGEHVEEEFSAGLLEGHESELIDDEKGDAAKSLLQTRKDPRIARFGQGADQVGGPVERDVVTALDRLDAEGCGQMGLSGADGA